MASTLVNSLRRKWSSRPTGQESKTRDRLRPGRIGFRMPFLERLEDRTMLSGNPPPVQGINYAVLETAGSNGALAFYLPSAVNVTVGQNQYEFSGTNIELGLEPSGGAANFQPVYVINGTVDFTDDTTTNPMGTFTVTGAFYSAAQVAPGQPPATPLEQVTDANFNATDLIASGLSLASPSQVSFAGITFKIIAIGVQPDPTSMGANPPEVAAYQGSLQFGPDASNLTLAVSYPNFVYVTPSGTLSMTGAAISITTSFNLFGVQIAPDNLSFLYTSQTSEFQMYGSVTASIGNGENKESITANFGTSTSPGLDIVDGSLKTLSLGVTGEFEVGPVKFEANRVTLAYVAGSGDSGDASAEFNLTGTMTVVLTKSISGSLSLPDPGIVLMDGNLQIDALTIEVGNIPLGIFSLQDLTLSYSMDGDSVGGSVNVVLPLGWGVGGSLLFVGGRLDNISISYKAQGTKDDPVAEGIPVADTGLFLTDMSAGVANLDQPANLIVSGSMGVDYGGQVEILGQECRIFSAEGSFSCSASELTLDGSLFVGGYIDTSTQQVKAVLGQGSASLDLNWGAHVYSANVNASIFAGTFTFQLGFSYNAGGQIYINGDAKVNVPNPVPLIGGDNLASMNFVFEYEPPSTAQGLAVGEAAAWVTLGSHAVGFGYDLQGGFSILGSQQIAALSSGGSLVNGNYTYTTTVSNLPVGASAATLSAAWPSNIGGSQTLSVTDPNGITYSQNNGQLSVSANPNNKAALAATLIQTAPPPQGQLATTGQLAGAASSTFTTLPPGNYTVTLTSSQPLTPNFTTTYAFPVPIIDSPALPGLNKQHQATSATVQVQLTGYIDSAFLNQATFSVYATTSNDPSVRNPSLLPKGTLLPQAFADSSGNPVGQILPRVLKFADAQMSTSTNDPASFTVDPTTGQYTINVVVSLFGLLPVTYYLYGYVNDGNSPSQQATGFTAVLPAPEFEGLITAPQNSQNGTAPAVPGVLVYLNTQTGTNPVTGLPNGTNPVTGNPEYTPPTFDPTTKKITQRGDPFFPTSSSGYYDFYNLTAGTQYQLDLVVPHGYTVDATSPNFVPDPTNAQMEDPSQPNGKPLYFTYSPPYPSTPTINFAVDKLAAISGTVFNQYNGAETNGVGGVTLTLTGTLDDGTPYSTTATTDHDGVYEFLSVPVATKPYTITLDSAPLLFTLPNPATTTRTVTISSTYQQAGSNNFDVQQYSQINGTLSGYLLSNNQLSTQATFLPGQTVDLLNSSGTKVASSVTDPAGEYTFPQIAQGNYTVQQEVPTGLTQVAPVEAPVSLSAPTSMGSSTGHTAAWITTGNLANQPNEVDIAFVRPNSGQDYSLEVAFGAPSQNLGTRTYSGSLKTKGDNIELVVVGDFRHVGLDDVITISQMGQLDVFPNDCCGNFNYDQDVYTFSRQISNAVVADFNGDGFADLAISDEAPANGNNNGNPPEIQALLNTTTTTMKNGNTTYNYSFHEYVTPTYAGGGGLAAGVLDTSGRPSIVFIGRPSNSLTSGFALETLAWNSNQGTFTSTTASNTLPDNVAGGLVTLADLNGDGNLDAIFEVQNQFLPNTQTTIYGYLGSSDGLQMDQEPLVILNSNRAVHEIIGASFHADPFFQDLAFSPNVYANASYGPGNELEIFTNPGTPTGFLTAQPYVLALSFQPQYLASADVNGDGLPDLLLGIADTNGVQVYYGQLGTASGVPVAAAGGSIAGPAFVDVQYGQIFGTVTVDNNRNGIQEAREKGLAGIQVYLDHQHTGIYDPRVDPSTTTDASGNYTFNNVPNGDYQVRVVVPDGMTLSGTTHGLRADPVKGAPQHTLVDFSLTPNLLRSVPEQSIAEGSPLSVTAFPTGATRGHTLTYSLESAPDGAQIDPSSGVISWTPSTAQAPGSYKATVRVTDLSQPHFTDVTPVTIDVAPSPTGYVAALYRFLLGRPASTNEVATWLAAMAAGQTRSQVTSSIFASQEHRTVEVDDFYLRYLQRPADAAGEANWVNRLLAGVTETAVIDAFLASAEYSASHGTTDQFVAGLYQDVLRRGPSASDLDYWRQIVSRGANRADVALAFLTSDEAYVDLVNTAYQTYFNRSAASAELAGWLIPLEQHQTTPVQVEEAILSADEFFGRY